MIEADQMCRQGTSPYLQQELLFSLCLGGLELCSLLFLGCLLGLQCRNLLILQCNSTGEGMVRYGAHIAAGHTYTKALQPQPPAVQPYVSACE